MCWILSLKPQNIQQSDLKHSFGDLNFLGRVMFLFFCCPCRKYKISMEFDFFFFFFYLSLAMLFKGRKTKQKKPCHIPRPNM